MPILSIEDKDLSANSWIGPLGLAISSLFIAASVGIQNKTGQALILFSVACAVGSIFLAIKTRSSRGKYDLRTLEKVHRQKLLEEIDEHTISPDADQIVCPHCGNDYSTKFPCCPNCGMR